MIITIQVTEKYSNSNVLQFAMPKKQTIGPQTLGTQKYTIQKTKKSTQKNTAFKMQTEVFPIMKYVAHNIKYTSKHKNKIYDFKQKIISSNNIVTIQNTNEISWITKYPP